MFLFDRKNLVGMSFTYLQAFVTLLSDNSVFWFKIVDISSTKITLLSKLGDTTVYQKVK